MEVDFTLNADDFWRLNRYALLHLPRLRKNLVANAVAVFGVPFFVYFAFTRDLPASLVAGIVVGIPLAFFVYWNFRRQIRWHSLLNQGLIGEHRLSIGPEGVRKVVAGAEESVAWAEISGVVNDDKHLYLFREAPRAYIVPKRAFATADEARRFYEQALLYWRHRCGGAGQA